MNIHEECLIKYLTNPLSLFQTTELLKINNVRIEKEMIKYNYTKNNKRICSDLA